MAPRKKKTRLKEVAVCPDCNEVMKEGTVQGIIAFKCLGCGKGYYIWDDIKFKEMEVPA